MKLVLKSIKWNQGDFIANDQLVSLSLFVFPLSSALRTSLKGNFRFDRPQGDQIILNDQD